jgi:hypothetical protein
MPTSPPATAPRPGTPFAVMNPTNQPMRVFNHPPDGRLTIAIARTAL